MLRLATHSEGVVSGHWLSTRLCLNPFALTSAFTVGSISVLRPIGRSVRRACAEPRQPALPLSFCGEASATAARSANSFVCTTEASRRVPAATDSAATAVSDPCLPLPIISAQANARLRGRSRHCEFVTLRSAGSVRARSTRASAASQSKESRRCRRRQHGAWQRRHS